MLRGSVEVDEGFVGYNVFQQDEKDLHCGGSEVDVFKSKSARWIAETFGFDFGSSQRVSLGLKVWNDSIVRLGGKRRDKSGKFVGGIITITWHSKGIELIEVSLWQRPDTARLALKIFEL